MKHWEMAGNCPKCGNPIWAQVEHSPSEPPQIRRSCLCLPKQDYVPYYVPYFHGWAPTFPYYGAAGGDGATGGGYTVPGTSVFSASAMGSGGAG